MPVTAQRSSVSASHAVKPIRRRRPKVWVLNVLQGTLRPDSEFFFEYSASLRKVVRKLERAGKISLQQGIKLRNDCPPHQKRTIQQTLDAIDSICRRDSRT